MTRRQALFMPDEAFAIMTGEELPRLRRTLDAILMRDLVQGRMPHSDALDAPNKVELTGDSERDYVRKAWR